MNYSTPIEKSNYIPINPELLDKLQEKAQASNRDLIDFVESILMDAVYHEPNEETLAAIKEARAGKITETLDLEHFDEFVKSL